MRLRRTQVLLLPRRHGKPLHILAHYSFLRYFMLRFPTPCIYNYICHLRDARAMPDFRPMIKRFLLIDRCMRMKDSFTFVISRMLLSAPTNALRHGARTPISRFSR